jgi:hypothetical protein
MPADGDDSPRVDETMRAEAERIRAADSAGESAGEPAEGIHTDGQCLRRRPGTGGSNPPLSALESQESCARTRSLGPGSRVFRASSGASRGQTQQQQQLA